MKNAKYGLALGMHFKESIPVQALLAAKVGFYSVFTEWSEEKDKDTDEWAVVIRDAGLVYQSIHAPFVGVQALWQDGEAGERYTDTLIRCLDSCARNAVRIMVAHVCIGMDEHTPTAIGLKRFARLLAAAEERGITVAFENTEGMEFLEAIMKEYSSSPYCGFCWDTGHEQCYNYGQDMMALYGNKLVATHINDNLGMTDRNIMTWHDDAHLLPFDGIIDWKHVVERMDAVGYKGIYTAELNNISRPGKTTHERYASWSCEEFFREALKCLQRISALS